jgi:5-methylcytosine-specific restriction endonuclease McrA
MAIYEEDWDQFYLGKVCKRDHRWKDLDYGLRRSSGGCYVCELEKRARKAERKRRLKQQETDKRRTLAESLGVDLTLYQLGTLCARGHDYMETGYSLQYKSSRCCVDCRALTGREYAQTEKGRESARVSLAKYRASAKGKKKQREYASSEKGKESRRRAFRKWRISAKGRECMRRHDVARKDDPRRRLSYKKKAARRRAQKKQYHVSYTVEQILERFVLFDNTCAYCDCQDDLTNDHVKALNRGGWDEVANIVPACRKCNSSKSDRPVEEWYPEQDFFEESRLNKVLVNMEGSHVR